MTFTDEQTCQIAIEKGIDVAGHHYHAMRSSPPAQQLTNLELSQLPTGLETGDLKPKACTDLWRVAGSKARVFAVLMIRNNDELHEMLTHCIGLGALHSRNRVFYATLQSIGDYCQYCHSQDHALSKIVQTLSVSTVVAKDTFQLHVINLGTANHRRLSIPAISLQLPRRKIEAAPNAASQLVKSKESEQLLKGTRSSRRTIKTSKQLALLNGRKKRFMACSRDGVEPMDEDDEVTLLRKEVKMPIETILKDLQKSFPTGTVVSSHNPQNKNPVVNGNNVFSSRFILSSQFHNEAK
ncbi:hypothetical protein BDB00DRAFT_867763 [Zychaea mexicana]|uniref:uncharacterized protein n=1 Tax=Zychaea mexicana TaxID=64656 RepID=UPI0022FF417A|nr:uncharacterized protein BDB00DRAFT_867763 [Zychaea mexicana]KAI9498110.1 hypothetical protein BDB00DRAFT_867763 [Zychaea mexicana]